MRSSASRWIANVVILTLGMGIAVTVSWFAFAARHQSYGLDPASFLAIPRLLAYGSQFLLVGGFVYWFVLRRLKGASPERLATVVVAAWVGQGLVLTVIGEPLVANELDAEIAWYYWIVATGGPLQPLVAFGGGALASWRARCEPRS